ncbi:hypothetical protein [Phthorimaea operculella granulovirus]|uniref:Uncharacterized protein n=1 Tax=Phthorimaea operculella granulovirus TaxID=192584 RepID=Q8JRT2_9BBAC|nr:hypothetical protein [Phthorimaea operculella granulovirus]AAM70325.1 hypothetical protein [Phthorimaea operculella granulovirus]ANY57516.1 hypothetical protein PhopGVgp127 [Phthorimaea operculella granulovirus]QBH65962.1 hypothetical protein PhopGVgp127 [Phthorimaea operculella granulovirus]QBH66092.1 hypothetical protein PhopGVgp127 [Phthorimaea operculella granulovirus]QBH66222.1 hypothetical protein PhopGVgp127 [Phthorimaea operculella granulovirus]
MNHVQDIYKPTTEVKIDIEPEIKTCKKCSTRKIMYDALLFTCGVTFFACLIYVNYTN